MPFFPSSQKESRNHALLDSLLHFARQLNETQDDEIDPTSMEEIVCMLVAENDFGPHTETLLFLEELTTEYKRFHRTRDLEETHERV